MITFTKEQIEGFSPQERDMFETLCAKHHAVAHISEDEKSEEEIFREEQARMIKDRVDRHFKKTDDREHREWLEGQFEKGSILSC